MPSFMTKTFSLLALPLSMGCTLLSGAIGGYRCGDGIRDEIKEECDNGEGADGNSNLPNACRVDCTQPFCGDGVIDTEFGELCDGGAGCSPTCQSTTCGNGVVEAPVEECDDANNANGDGCSDACNAEVCGDGDLDFGEQCDDGDDNSNTRPDACRLDCTLFRCGDGFVDSQEGCDDGDNTDEDACKNNCQENVCGDAILNIGVEQCDDANNNNNDGCSNNCLLPSCGDGVVNLGEECDDANSSDEDSCLNTCQNARCGDGILRVGVEECDDANGLNTDACTNTCKSSKCGDGFRVDLNADGILDIGDEACDDGNLNNNDSCLITCELAACGDSFIFIGVEQCDDANTLNNDFCSNACTVARCGDGIIQPLFGEECDDTNALNTDACTSSCKDAACGDGFVRIDLPTNDPDFEECDDGDTNNGDFCPSTCKIAFCGDTFVLPGVEDCDDGNSDDGDSCTNSCSDAFCGDGVVRSNVEECDDNNNSNTDDCTNACEQSFCGDGFIKDVGVPGIIEPGDEECEESDLLSNDGCDTDCFVSRAISIDTGASHTCALTRFDGKVRCWGLGASGRLGYASTTSIGDNTNEMPAKDVNIGPSSISTPISQLEIGNSHTCTLSQSGVVLCWGHGEFGRLGYGNQLDVGDNESPASRGGVDIGGAVLQIAVGGEHTCALLNTGNVRCWGVGDGGRLGYGNELNIGDDETPASAGDVNVGGVVTQIAAGGGHTCALLSTGNVRCWGFSSLGRLGYGNTNDIGDNESPASAGDISLLSAAELSSGVTVTQLTAGELHTCARLSSGAARCWGAGAGGRLGYGNVNSIGDTETPASAGDVNVGGSVAQITAGDSHTCVLLSNGNARCWGAAGAGRLGYGNLTTIGDTETPASAGDVPVLSAAESAAGVVVTQISARGGFHTCALLSTGNIRCWGTAGDGRLGYGNVNNIGDNETPASAGDVNVGGVVSLISAGRFNSCAVLDAGVRCWGVVDEDDGRLGNFFNVSIGDDEPAAASTLVFVGATPVGSSAEIAEIALGDDFSCVLLVDGVVRCWGRNSNGRLGISHAFGGDIGDNETPNLFPDVFLGGVATQITAGGSHACALLQSGNVRCWGLGASGQLGYANTNTIGDNETPASIGDVNVGGVVTQISAGSAHTCALLDSGNVRCWGLGTSGQLGYGNINNIGDTETPASAGDVNVGGVVTQISASGSHTCALLSNSTVRCWGLGASGQLGLDALIFGTNNNFGDEAGELPSTRTVLARSSAEISAGLLVAQLAGGGSHTCALYSSGEVRCWGAANFGQLGYGSTDTVGISNAPSEVGFVDIGDKNDDGLSNDNTQISLGSFHTCVVLNTGGIRCWGLGTSGRLGYNTQIFGIGSNLGDELEEFPSSEGDVPVFER